MKKGDKYVIEISEVEYFWDDNGVSYPLARIKGFSALTFDERGLDRLEKIDASKPVEKKKLYNCKFVVVSAFDEATLTVGKIYDLVDGHFTDDVDNTYPTAFFDDICSFEELRGYLRTEFDISPIEILEIKE